MPACGREDGGGRATAPASEGEAPNSPAPPGPEGCPTPRSRTDTLRRPSSPARATRTGPTPASSAP